MLAEASFVIHHGGAGTSEACLTAGRTQILVPRHLEQSMTARSLRARGVGFILSRDTNEELIAKTVQEVAADAAALERAVTLSREIAARGPRPGVAPIVGACEALLARSPAAVS